MDGPSDVAVPADSFETFLARRREVGAAYVNGDATPLDGIVTTSDPATFLSPMGDVVEGAAAVADRYRRDAGSFSPGGTSRFEVLQSASSGDVAWWTGYQVAEAILGDATEPTPMRLRLTEGFRFEDGEWKLVHRHADRPEA